MIRLFIIRVFQGIAIGIANIIPGVSGGTIAVVLGVYDQLIESIGQFFQDKTKRTTYFFFLLQIMIGALIGIKGFAFGVHYCLQHFPGLTASFFMGLILGSIPIIYRSHSDMKLSVSKSFLFVFSVFLLFILSGDCLTLDTAKLTGSVSVFQLFWLCFSGVIAGGAMVVPGVSGSMMLLILGTYPIILVAISDIQLTVLCVVALGAGLGVYLFAKLIYICLKRAPSYTYYGILGLMVGSVIKLWPGCSAGFLGVVFNICSALVGIGISLMLRKTSASD